MNDNVLFEEIKNRIHYEKNDRKKKIILYSVGSAAALGNSETFLDKLDFNLSVFEENKDKVIVIFSVQEGLREKFLFLCPDSIDRYDDVISSYESKSYVISINSNNVDRVCDLCDAYYGDWGIGALICKSKGKPVMIQYYPVPENDNHQ